MERLQLIRRTRGILLVLALVGWFAVGQSTPLHADGAQGGGFMHRVFRDASGQHKYVIFVPWNYRADRAWPVILYLHGAGERGADGQVQTTIGIGPFVKERQANFPFIVVFPQCEDTKGRILTAWSPTSADGKRALEILDLVERDFNVDQHRQIVTGWSMGGYGAWSMAAAFPQRWSAVVPLSGGGDPAWASQLTRLPIWAFHGANDEIVRVQESRQMIEAIRAAGGHPLYTEIPNAGHDIWKTVYNDNRLYQWLQSPTMAPQAGSTAAAANPSAARPSARPGVRPELNPSLEAPFVPALMIPSAISVRLGNDALTAIAHSIPRLIPADALTGGINDIYSSTESSGYTFGVQFSRIGYTGQVERAFMKAYAKDRLNIQLALRNVALTIGSTYVQGSGRSAVAGPIQVVIGYRYPVWLSFDVTPRVQDGRLRLQLAGASFQIPNDDWYVTAPYGVSVSGLGMTQERVSSGLVEGIYGQKYRIEQEALAIVPSLVARMEERLNLSEASQFVNAFWPLPVYRPRLKVLPESASVDEKGISLVMGVVAAAVDPRQAPHDAHTEPSAGVTLESIPQSTNMQFGIAPSILEPLTRLLIEGDVARIHVLDIPNKAFAAFADRNALSQVLPDIANLPKDAELWAELSLVSPIQVRDAQGGISTAVAAAPKSGSNGSANNGERVNMTVLKPTDKNRLNGEAASKSTPGDAKSDKQKSPSGTKPADVAASNHESLSASGQRSFEFVIPKAKISIAYKDNAKETQWKPYAEFEVEMSQKATATVARRGFSERILRVDWTGEPTVKATARFDASYTPKNSSIQADRLRSMFTEAWGAWTHNGPASAAPVEDIDFGFSKLRLDTIQWAPPVIAATFDDPGIKITNQSKADLVYEIKGAYSAWSSPITLEPGKSNEFRVVDPVLYRRVVGGDFTQFYTLPVGSAFEFKPSASGGSPGLYKVREPVVSK